MLVYGPIFDELDLLMVETDDEEGDNVHLLCCVTESNDISLNKSLCGVIIDNPEEPREGIDQDCLRCDILAKARYCPLFGECQGE